MAKIAKRKTSKSKTKRIKNKKYFYCIGRRKSAVATVRLYRGKGDSFINKKNINDIYVSKTDINDILKPFETTETEGKYYFTAIVKGGGKYGQLDAVKLALSRALEKVDSSFRKPLKEAKFLRVDSRLKERKKIGLKKARKKEQYSKR